MVFFIFKWIMMLYVRVLYFFKYHDISKIQRVPWVKDNIWDTRSYLFKIRKLKNVRWKLNMYRLFIYSFII